MRDEKQPLTKRQGEAYLLVSPDAGGKTVEEAAIIMDITVRAVYSLLEAAEKARPDLFPIITKREYEVLTLVQDGETRYEIANKLEVSLRRVDQIISSLRDKGRDVSVQNPGTVSYQSWMDDQVKEKF